MFEFRTGLPRRDLPERFGPWQTVHGRFARRAADGTFDGPARERGFGPGAVVVVVGGEEEGQRPVRPL